VSGKPLEILPGLIFLQRGFLSGNHFVYRAARPILIDTAYRGEAQKTLDAIEALGCDWRATERILSTHCHCDHVGVNHIVQTASGCAVAMHPVGAAAVNRRDGLATWWDYYVQEAEYFDAAETLEEGAEVAVGPHRFTVLHAPGHSRDTLMLYERSQRILLSSDALWESDMAVITARVEGEDAATRWLDTLERAASLDVTRVYPGHGAPFADFRGALEKTRDRLRRFADHPEEAADDLLRKITVYTLLMGGGAEEASFFNALMATPWFPETVARHFGGEYRKKYDETLARLLARGAVALEGGRLLPRVPA